MNETETQQLYQIIFGGDRSQGWQSWQRNAAEAGIVLQGRTGEMATQWKGGATMTRGYRQIYIPIHPRATKLGYVLEHVLVCEVVLGRFLPDDAVPHHINGNKADNRPENIVLCQNRAHHNLIHKRQRALQECGNPDWHRCKFCHQWSHPDTLYIMVQKGETIAWHRACVQQWKLSKAISKGRAFTPRGARGPYKKALICTAEHA